MVLPGHARTWRRTATIYRLSDGFFSDLHLPARRAVDAAGVRTGHAEHRRRACVRGVSDLYLINSQGGILRQLSHNATAQVPKVWLNHWMFWPRFGPDGNTMYFSYDQPKNSGTYAVDFSVWSGLLNGKLANKQLTNSNPFTGGDVEPTPMANGA